MARRIPHTRRPIASPSLTRLHAGFLRSLVRKRPETRGTYERALREFMRWSAGTLSEGFDRRDVERYKRHLTTRKKLSPASVSTYLTALRRFCEYLVQSGALPENPARSVKGNSRPAGHSRATLTGAEVDTLLASVDLTDERGPRDRAFIALMVGCALSEIEIVRANVSDLIAGEGSASLRVQGKGRVRKDQRVRLSAEVRAAIDAALAGRGNLAPGDPLFISAGNRTRGKRMTTRGVRDRVNLYLERSGIKRGGGRRISPYSLRHTAAALMAAAGATPDEIQQRMRLGSMATAMLYVTRHEEHSSGS